MKAKSIINVLYKALGKGHRILLVGRPGIGKTALIKKVGKQLAYPVVVLYSSIADPTDFKGYPCIIDGTPKILAFDELDKILNAIEPVIVFLDDFGQGAPAVQAAQMSFLDRCLDNPNIRIVAATNRREDRAGVSGLLEPIKSRMDSIINMEFDMDEWIEWALGEVDAGNMPIELVAFNKFRDLMYSTKPSQDIVNGPCPRTVAALGKLMMDGHAPEDEYEVYSGAVGEGYTAELMGFIPIMRKMPNIDTILMSPESVTLPDENDKYAPAVYFAIMAALAKRANENTIDRIIKFADRIPKTFVEFTVSLIIDCVKSAPEIMNTAAYIAWQSRNKHIII